jgi:hypothetical protein
MFQVYMVCAFAFSAHFAIIASLIIPDAAAPPRASRYSFSSSATMGKALTDIAQKEWSFIGTCTVLARHPGYQGKDLRETVRPCKRWACSVETADRCSAHDARGQRRKWPPAPRCPKKPSRHEPSVPRPRSAEEPQALDRCPLLEALGRSGIIKWLAPLSGWPH